MSSFPDTRISLILRLAAAEDVEAWREFAAVYAPAVFAMARRRGLQAADAEDFLQELLLAVARAAGRWQPDESRARFRTWLYRVARNLLADHFARRAASAPGLSHGPNSEATLADCGQRDENLDQEFELEYRRALFHRAARLVRERVSAITWEAFAATAIDEVPAAAVSSQLGISTGNVYVARSRVMKLLREEVERLQRSVESDMATEANTAEPSAERAEPAMRSKR